MTVCFAKPELVSALAFGVWLSLQRVGKPYGCATNCGNVFEALEKMQTQFHTTYKSEYATATQSEGRQHEPAPEIGLEQQHSLQGVGDLEAKRKAIKKSRAQTKKQTHFAVALLANACSSQSVVGARAWSHTTGNTCDTIARKEWTPPAVHLHSCDSNALPSE
jgi:hypothetical protein